jgi:long-chain acyl-CoA synthetase
MGGKMRILFSGGAPLSPEIKDFLQVIFSVNMFESYGTTETAGFLTSTAIWDR